MSLHTRARIAVSLRLLAATAASALALVSEFDVTRKWLGITGIWEDPSNYYLASIAVALFGIFVPHPFMRPSVSRVVRRIGLVWCILVLVAASFGLAVRAVFSIGIML